MGWSAPGGCTAWWALAPGGLAVLAAAGLIRAGRAWAVVWPVLLLAAGLTGSGYWLARHAPPGGGDLARYVTAAGRLVDVTGRITGEVRLDAEPPDALGRFMFARPHTTFTLGVERVHTESGALRMCGGLQVRAPGLDARWRSGDRVRCRGWMRSASGPMNAGERDYAAALARRGVVGRLALKNRGNVRLVEAASYDAVSEVRRGHHQLGEAAAALLRAGMDRGADRASATALVEALVLGRRSVALADIYDAFRKTGLAHLLSVSGLHVGLLAAGVWAGVALATGRPRTAAIAGAVAAGVYLLIVPARVPIVRAGFMTIAFCLGLSWSRRISSGSLMATIGLVWLVWRPGDVLDAGFQLSFGIVAALLCFVGPVSRRLQGRPPLEASTEAGGARATLKRVACDYVAVSVIAWLVAMPLVAYHFGLVSPLAVVMGVAVLPLAAVMLWVGFAKIMVTAVWPWAGAGLAEPLVALGRLCERAVRLGAELPGSWAYVPQPSWLWAVAALAVVVALLAGRFAGRRAALAGCVVVCGAWLYVPGVAWAATAPPLRVDMLAVGDGSCFVVRSGGRAMLFDCGSSNYAEIGRYTIVPALRALNVGRLDAIVVSHPDYDHFSGTLDVVDYVPVARVLTTGHALADARGSPRGATAYLLDGLRRRGVAIELVEAGWSRRLGDAQVTAVWPPPGATFEHNNDASIVLAFDAAGRRVCLCGDVQAQAMTRMLDGAVALGADVTDLPHHGSFPPPAGDWLDAVGPRVVLQSSSPARLRWDKWAGHLDGIDRWITARHGMVTVTIERSGRIDARPFVRP